MSKRILVIDDDQTIRELFILTLEDTGYQVDTAESGEKGIEMAQNNKYDLIYLDLKMPGLDGVETLRALHKIDRDVPIYIITTFHAEFFSKLKSAAEEGLNFEIIEKPFGSSKIVLVTKGVLEGPKRY